MILVAGYIRKEVTSTAMWMLNHGIFVQCFKATPYQYGEELLLDIEQIIPVKEAAEYLIKMADKAKEAQAVKENSKGIEVLRKKYWTELLERFNGVSKQFQNVNPSTDQWLSSGSGVSGIPFTFVVTKNYISVELLINRGNKEMNEKIFDVLYGTKNELEKDFGNELTWEKLDEKKSCRVSYRMENADITDCENWEKFKEFQCDAMVRFDKTMRQAVSKAVKEI